MKKRIPAFDILKIMALFLVINSHFVAQYAADVKGNVLISHLLNGLTGKFALSLFALIAGYFSYEAGKKKELFSYLGKRYLFFFACCFVADICFYLCNVNGARQNSSIGMLASEILFLGDYYCDTFWFIRDFLIGSFFAFLAGRSRFALLESGLFVLVLFYLKQPFIGAYVAGCLLQDLKEREFFKKNAVQISLAAFFLVFFFFYRKESNLMYFEDTLRALALALPGLQLKANVKEKTGKVLSYLSSMSMALLMGHVLAFELCDNLSFARNLHGFVLYLFWLLITFVSGIMFDFVIRLLYRFLLKGYGRIEAGMGRL